jgi:hypothetical protein
VKNDWAEGENFSILEERLKVYKVENGVCNQKTFNIKPSIKKSPTKIS